MENNIGYKVSRKNELVFIRIDMTFGLRSLITICIFYSFIPFKLCLIPTLMVPWCFLSRVQFSHMCVDSYHSKSIIYVSYEVQELGS